MRVTAAIPGRVPVTRRRGRPEGPVRRSSNRLAVAAAWGLALLLAVGAWPGAGHADDLERAIALADEGRLEEADQALAPLLAQDPDHFRGRLLQANLRVREGRLDEAAGLFEALRDDHPERPEPYNNLAAVYVAQDRLDEALAALLSARERAPELTAVHANLADLYQRLADRSRDRSQAGAETPGAEREREPATEDGVIATAPLPLSDESGLTDVTASPFTADACVRATGFRDVADAAAAEAWLGAWGADVHVHRELGAAEYWVYLPPLPSREEAIATTAELRARGVEDIAVVGRGPLANSVSLGLYRVEPNMRRRVAALQAMGYPVEYKTTAESVREYRLEAALAADSNFMHVDWKARFPGHPLELVDCD